MDECPNCGAEVSSSDKRCKKCGEELKNKNKKLLIGIVIVVVIIAIIGIFAGGMLSNSSNNDVNVINNTDSNNSSNVDSQDDSGVVFWASKNATKFHKPNCEWAQKIKDSNKIVYHSREDALNDGREPCGECNP